MKLSKRVLVGAGVLVLLIVAAILIGGGGTEAETVAVQQSDVTCTVDETGYVQAVVGHNLYTAEGGKVIALKAETGDEVKQGQTLATLQNVSLAIQVRDAEIQLAAARSATAAAQAQIERTKLELANAQADLARLEQLLAAGAATRVEHEKASLLVKTFEEALDEQNAHYRSASSQVSGLEVILAQLQANENLLTVKSPIDGTVLSLPVTEGDVLPPGMLVATVAVTDRLEIKTDVLTDDLTGVSIGQPVEITAPFLGDKTLAGKVEKIFPQAEERQSALGITQRRVPVIISLTDASGLKPGFEVDVAIETVRRSGVPVLPREAVRTLADGRKQVMSVVNGRVSYKLVETGISNADSVEITGGVKAGDLVIRDGSVELQEGTRIK